MLVAEHIHRMIFKRSLRYVLSFVSLLWLIKFFEWITDVSLVPLGVYPSTLKGALGIITSPLVHGDGIHLLSNTFPLIMLGIGLFYFYYHIASKVFVWIYLLSGTGVWLVAREAYHIGASGIIYGLLSFLFFIGLFNRDNKSIVISLIVLFLYGGMIGGFFPSDFNISYESHMMGAFSGLLVAFTYRRQPMTIYDTNEQQLEDPSASQMEDTNFSPPTHTHESPGIHINVVYRQNEKSND